MTQPERLPDFPTGGCAVVIGGSGGIGRAIAVQLAERGCDVALSYFKGGARADETASLVRSAGREVHVGQVDLREEAEVRRFVDEAAQHFGGVHTAIYAAGPYIPMRFIGQQPAAAFREVMEHDAFGCFHLVQAALPHLRTAKGSFTAIVTPAIRRYAVRDILSAAPKAAIEQLVKGLAAEEGRFGVRANAVGVGVITDGLYHALVESGDFDQRFLDASRQAMALKRLGTADEVAEGVVFLASQRARWITGQTLMVDGGYAV
ncbi:MAG: SDR family oxidoreductase [Reyranella sp.]|nr:SDR family oxidoreductase [Reyranella sp.]